jgi:hypothetical protein
MIVSFRLTIDSSGRLLSLALIRYSRTAEPDLSIDVASSIISARPKLCQISLAALHLNKRCSTSSGHVRHMGHSPLEPICLLAKILLRGRIPCKALQMKILTFPGICSFHKIRQTGFIADVPGADKPAALPLN